MMKARYGYLWLAVLCTSLAMFTHVATAAAPSKSKTGQQIEHRSPLAEQVYQHARQNRIPGNPLDDQGGPDAAGYRYVDNQAGDTATYAWIELCGDPNATDGPSGDEGLSTASWSWSFPFYGTSYSSANVGTNAWITFGTGDIGWSNTCPFATDAAVLPTIAVYWDDLEAGPSGGCLASGPWIRWRDFGNYFVIEWRDVHAWGDTEGHLTFEAILFPNGKIKLQYANMVNPLHPNEASVGIDAPGTGNGVEYLQCNATTFPDGTANRAVWFYPGAPPMGRCCYYGDPANPTCSNTTIPACEALAGAWTADTTCAQSPCPASCVVCQSGDVIEPAETIDPNHLQNDPNGGCGLTFSGGSGLWGTMECGQTICGRCFSYTGPDGSLLHDTDGYHFTIYDSVTVTATLEAAFPAALALLDWIDCDILGFMDVQFSDAACNPVQINTACLGLPAGTYTLAVLPTTQDQLPLSYYRLSLECTPCGTACGPAQHLTVHRTTPPTNAVNLRWIATQNMGTYEVWRTSAPNNDGDPDGGADPAWSLVTAVPAPANAPATLTATDSPLAPYANYVVVHNCTVVPSNDNCQNPITLSGPLPITVTGSTINATNDYSCQGLGETMPGCWRGPFYDQTISCAAPDVVYDWVVPASGLYNFSLCESAYNADMLIYNFTCPTEPANPGDFICGSSDNCPGGSFSAAVNGLSLNAGQHILIVVDGYGQDRGPFTLTVSQ